MDFNQSPFLVIWEVTQACLLACQHCRASAQPLPLPGELSTQEGEKLLRDIHEMGCNIVVLSGGDPLQRKDLSQLIAYGKSIGLRMATIPAATDLLTFDAIKKLKDANIDQIAFSLDFPNREMHDAFRSTPGAYDKTMKGIEWAKQLGIPLQINTTITSESLRYLPEMAELVSKLGIVFWEVFFLVPTGRGGNLLALSPQECERAFSILFDLHQKCSFILKVTEAPHYRRFVAQREGLQGGLPKRLHKSEGPGGSLGHAPKTVNSGNGFIFVNYKGDVFPSGFLPITVGNVRRENIQSIYRNSSLLKKLRDPLQLKGKCLDCQYRGICAGSRSRAYAMTNDPFEEEPWCDYQPPAKKLIPASLHVLNS